MDINYALIGMRIRAVRLKRGYTQELVSERADVSPPHYSKIESGRTKLSLPCLVRICNALEITPDEILMDSVDNSTPTLIKEVAAVFSGCTGDEIFHMLSVAQALKKSMQIRNHNKGAK
ncbi:MAG: helix-turn-helix transcriptional regulator [Defluviitaleaceae bacterium]|nr:helix-turn-helix transcriptional regulator [Defluviitaleaceae bacterium]